MTEERSSEFLRVEKEKPKGEIRGFVVDSWEKK